MSPHEVDLLLSQARPLTPRGADLVLDLRQLLLDQGHPGDCVHCFFSLLGDLKQPAALRPLKTWLENHLEIAVKVDDELKETLPVEFNLSQNLHDYCHHVIETVQQDRAYQGQKIQLAFSYSK